MSDNSGCVTGILIDISNVNDQEIVKSSSESAFSFRKPKIFDLDDLKQYETAMKQPTETLKLTKNGFQQKRSPSSNIDDSERIEDEIFDFYCFPKSPNSSFGSDDDTDDIWSTKENEDTLKWSSSEEMSLNTEELAEVFREATTVAVKLENYVQKRNRTPVKSPNHMKLLLERSAQKKLKEKSPKEVEIQTEEQNCETIEMTTKKEVTLMPLPKLIETPATPALKKAVNPVRASKAGISALTNFRTKARSSSVGPIARSGPVKAIPIVPKQTNTSTFRSSSSSSMATTTARSVIPSRLSNNTNVQSKTSVVRSNSTVLKPTPRPVLNRCNSFHSEITTPKTTADVTPKPQSRRSFSGFTPLPATPAPIGGSKRRSLLAVPTPKAVLNGSSTKATPLSNNKKTFDGSHKATPMRAAKKFV